MTLACSIACQEVYGSPALSMLERMTAWPTPLLTKQHDLLGALLSLCKLPDTFLPRDEKQWLKHLASTAIRIDKRLLTALEIEHLLLRATMPPAKLSAEASPYRPQWPPSDPRTDWALQTNVRLLSFGMVLPTK